MLAASYQRSFWVVSLANSGKQPAIYYNSVIIVYHTKKGDIFYKMFTNKNEKFC